MDPVSGQRLIPVRDRQQAREWSLALISQGITSTLQHDEVADTWALAVAAEQRGPALRVLKLYHVENRGWGIRSELPGVHLAFDWAALAWAFVLVVIHYVATLPGSRLAEAGVLSHAAGEAGEWWRPFTAMTLHGDLAHLIANVASGTLFLGLAMARQGAGLGICSAWLAGLVANLVALLVREPDYRSLGASGMVLAVLGMLTATGVAEARRRQPGWKPLFAVLAAGLMLFVMTGANPTSDVLVHLGGFIAGLGAGTMLEAGRDWTQNRRWLQACGLVVFGGTLAGAWLTALLR